MAYGSVEVKRHNRRGSVSDGVEELEHVLKMNKLYTGQYFSYFIIRRFRPMEKHGGGFRNWVDGVFVFAKTWGPALVVFFFFVFFFLLCLPGPADAGAFPLAVNCYK